MGVSRACSIDVRHQVRAIALSAFFLSLIFFFLISTAQAGPANTTSVSSPKVTTAASLIPMIRAPEAIMHERETELQRVSVPDSPLISPPLSISSEDVQLNGVNPEEANPLDVLSSLKNVNLSEPWYLSSSFDFNKVNAEDILFGSQCGVPSGLEQFTAFEEFYGHCLPDASKDYNIDHSADLTICSCISGDKTSLQGKAYAEEVSTDISADENRKLQNTMNSNIRRLNSVLAAEQNAMRIQASTLPTTDQGAELLAAAYTNRFKFHVPSKLESIRNSVAKSYAAISDVKAPNSLPMGRVEVPEPDPQLLSMDEPEKPYCIPKRSYLTARQMPTDPKFFEDLASLTTFQKNDWDYMELKKQFITHSLNVTNLKDALKNPAAKKIYLRLQFLERNPLYKNLFSADDRADGKKRELFDKIRTAYGPQVSPSKRLESFQELRRQTGAFFTEPAELMNDLVQSGADKNMSTLMGEIPRRVESIIREYNPALAWSTAAIQVGRTLEEDQNDNGRADVRIYAKYCPELMFASRQNQYAVLNELEQEFANSYSLDDDQEYLKLNAVCFDFRKSKDGKTTKSYDEYERETCQATPAECTPEKKPALLTKFLNEYPENPNEDEENPLLSVLKPFLENQGSVPKISEVAANRAGQSGRNKNFFRDNNVSREFREINGQFTSPATTSGSSIANLNSVQRTRPVASSVKDISSPVANGASGTFVASGAVQPGLAAPQAAPEIRAQMKQNENQSQQIRDQIADLRQSLERENAAPPQSRNSSAIQDLNGRLDALMAQLDSKDAEMRRLRSELAASQKVNPSPVRSVASRSDENIAPVRSNSSSTAAGNTTAGNITGPAIPLPSSMSGGGFSGPATLSPSAGRNSGSTRNSALLERYGLKSGSSAGALIVSPGSSVDYQQLRADSGANVIPLSVSAEEFNQIASNNQALERYFSQVQGKEGEVFRFAIVSQGTGQELELFAVKNGDKISLVPSGQVPAAQASRAPASAPERTNKLEDLNRELERAR